MTEPRSQAPGSRGSGSRGQDSAGRHANEPLKRPASEVGAILIDHDSENSVNSAADAPRPGPIVGGTLLVALRAVASVIWWIGFVREWPHIVREVGLNTDPETAGIVLTIFLVAGGVWTLFLLLLAFLLWRGSNAARILTMGWMTLSIALAAVDYVTNGAEITIRTTLLTLSLDILVLLALSSRAARVWARRPRRLRNRRAV